MAPALLVLLATTLNSEFHLDLRPKALDTLRLVPGANLKAHSPVGLALCSWQGSQDGGDGGGPGSGCPVRDPSVGVGSRVKGDGVGG